MRPKHHVGYRNVQNTYFGDLLGVIWDDLGALWSDMDIKITVCKNRLSSSSQNQIRVLSSFGWSRVPTRVFSNLIPKVHKTI